MPKGYKSGGRKKGTPNKLTAEVKEKIKHLLDGAIESIDLNECTIAERIRLIEIGLRDTLPTMKQIDNQPEREYQSIDFKNLIKWVD